MGNLGNIVDSIYLPRGTDDTKRAQALEAIKDRQDLIESTGDYTQLLIFPEGATSNGTSLLTFKKGAFIAEKTVTPVVMKFSVNTSAVNPAYDVIELLPLAIMQLSWSCITVDLIQLPDFQPNEFLFEKHANQGAERWNVFAWAVRTVMADIGGFKFSDVPHRTKMVYESYM